MRVRLIGVEPKSKPCESLDGWYDFSVSPGCTIAAVLERFGLEAGALSVRKNGSLAGGEDAADDSDELQIFLKSLGG